jgi:hypothetical protein
MSLDIYLTMPGVKRTKPAGRIFVREGGQTKELTRAEWDAKNPGFEPVTCGEAETDAVYEANITHNLGRMADAVGIYKCLWHPDELGITKASQLIEPLRAGLSLLLSDRDGFEQFNAENGWGTYEQFGPWLERLLQACEKFPDADVRVSI